MVVEDGGVVSENIIEVSNGFSHQEIGGAPFHTKTMIKTVMMTISKQHDDDHIVMFTTKVAKRGCPKGCEQGLPKGAPSVPKN